MRGYGDSVGMSVRYKRRRRMAERDESRKEEEKDKICMDRDMEKWNGQWLAT